MAIENQWIDYNGHFNMAYYSVLFDRAADQMFAELGLGPDYVKATNNSFFTLETHCSLSARNEAHRPRDRSKARSSTTTTSACTTCNR